MENYTCPPSPFIDPSSTETVPTSPTTTTTDDVRDTCVLFRIVFNSGLIAVICFLGLAGNILSLTILHSDRQNRVASFLLQALAVADTAVLVISCFVLSVVYGILHSQTTVVTEWMDFIFKYVNSLGYMTQGVTIWLTVLLAINRYIAVCRPLHASRLGIKGAKIQVCAVVIVSFISNIPRIILRDLTSSSSSSSKSSTSNDGVNATLTLTSALITRGYRNSSSFAPASSSSSSSSQQSPIMLFEILYTTLILILPLVILAGLNLRLIVELQGAKRRLRHFSRKYSGSNEDNITVVMVVVIVVVVICHTPDRIIQILRWIPLTESRSCPNWMYFSVSVSNLLIVVNSSINFLVYCVLRKRFRRILVLKVCHRRRRAKASPARAKAGAAAANYTCGRLLWSQYTSKNSDAIESNDAEVGAVGGGGRGSERSRNKTAFEMHSRRPERQSRLQPETRDNRYSLIV